jgi:SAM-dependent methyltransferase
VSRARGRTQGTADYYDAYWSEHGFDPDRPLLDSLRRILEQQVGPHDDCLDVGCGAGGGAAAWLAARSRSYAGVDVSPRAVDAARASGLDARAVDDASRLPFADGSFDRVVCVEVLEHLLDPFAAAREARRVLRPGGRLIATVPNVAYWRRRFDLGVLGRWNPLGDEWSAHRPWRDPHLRFFSRGNLAAMLREAGFDPVTTGGHGVSWLEDVPGARRLARRREPGPVFRLLTGLAPSLFAHHLHAVAVCPDRASS